MLLFGILGSPLISRLEEIADVRFDATDLALEEENLPQRIRHPRGL